APRPLPAGGRELRAGQAGRRAPEDLRLTVRTRAGDTGRTDGFDARGSRRGRAAPGTGVVVEPRPDGRLRADHGRAPRRAPLPRPPRPRARGPRGRLDLRQPEAVRSGGGFRALSAP